MSDATKVKLISYDIFYLSLMNYILHASSFVFIPNALLFNQRLKYILFSDDEDNKKSWQWSDDYDVQTVWVDLDNYKSSKAKVEEEEEGEEDVIYEKIEGEEEGEEGEEGEEEYYVVEEEEIIEEGVEDAHSEGMTNIEDEDLREEHLQAIKVHRKRKDYEVFVGGLDW